MELFEANQDAVDVVHVVGRVNSANAQHMAGRLDDILERGSRAIVLDLSRLEHMTSSGFRSLLMAERRAAEKKARFVLCGLQGLTLELFEIGGFLDMFEVAKTRDDALQRAAAPARV